jgi:hypothetical protein
LKNNRERKPNDDRDYWLTINFYRWEFLRRSKEYNEFYEKVKQQYLKPLKKYGAELRKRGLSHRQISAGRLHNTGPSDLVEQLRFLQEQRTLLSEQAHQQFNLSWRLMEKHYPKTLLNPSKRIKRGSVVFADYQQFSPYYNDLVFQPVIKSLTGLSASDFGMFKGLNPDYEIFAISTWGEPYISDETMEAFTEIIRETFKTYPKKTVFKNSFLLEPGKPIEIKELKLQAKKISEHWNEFIKTWDMFKEEKKKGSNQTSAKQNVADKLNISFEAVRSRIKKTNQLISEASRGRFYPLNIDSI